MIDSLPLEIRVEILKRFPVKSLIQFRIVSKAWKSLIDSSHFINHYSRYHTQQQHILVTYEEAGNISPSYVTITDDHTFPQTIVFPTIPLLFNMLRQSIVVGTSHGLLCLHGVYHKNQTNMAVLWNPSIRRAIPIVVPNVVYGIYDTLIGFGVCRVTIDPKIVKITYIDGWNDMERISCIPLQVEVFQLSTGVWRRPYSNNLPRKSIKFVWLWSQVVVDGVLYWRAIDRISTDGGYTSCNLIMSFDVTSEEFREVNLPDSLARESIYNLPMSKLRESLVVLHHRVEASNSVISVWMMEDGVSKLFTWMFTISVNTPDARVRGFRKSDEPIIEISDDDLPIFRLVVYDPQSKHVDYLGINGRACAFFVNPYMETLLLLDQTNLAICNEKETVEYLDGLV